MVSKKNSRLILNHISESAFIVAGCRMTESERTDSLYDDDYARLFFKNITHEVFDRFRNEPRFEVFLNGISIRTKVIDDLIEYTIDQFGIQQVVNLGCGLDCRPYRLNIDKELIWWECDHPHLIDYKASVLNEYPAKCILRRKKLDLIQNKELELFVENIMQSESKTLIISEGLLVYLTKDIVSNLYRIFGEYSHSTYWITDIATPANKLSDGVSGSYIFNELAAYMQCFIPANGSFFENLGWTVEQSKDIVIEGLKFNRPLTESIGKTKRDKLLSELQSLKWANLFFVQMLRNRSLSDQ